jgi:hypothetical protein
VRSGDADAVRQARVAAARRHQGWTEIDPADLVQRGYWMVSASTDDAYTHARGVIFERGSATVITANASLSVQGCVGSAGEMKR